VVVGALKSLQDPMKGGSPANRHTSVTGSLDMASLNA
jgi:hypothetical protein